MKYKYNGQWYELSIKALDGMPIGAIIAYPSSNIPNGWLECNGSTITSANYPELYDLIGGTLPNLKGRVIVGQDTSQTEFDTLGETGGSKELQAHSHTLNDQVGYNEASSRIQYTVGYGYARENTGIYTDNAGTGNSGNLQPYAVYKWIIKAKQTTPLIASVLNSNSNSTTDTYSCNYINNMIVSNWDANNSRGYIKYPDGTAICYGLYNPANPISVPANSGTSVEIPLPITLSNALYSVNLTKFAGGNGFSYVEENVNSPAVDKFYIGLWNNNSSGTCYVMGYYWQVVGRWK